MRSTPKAAPGPIAEAALDAVQGGATVLENGTGLLVVGDAGPETLAGGAGHDLILGADADDEISAGRGNDTIWAAGGSDVISAGAGKDSVGGGAGDDSVDGGAGADLLYGDEGNDRLSGGEEDAAADMAFGGEGDDTYVWGPGDGRDHFMGGPGNDRIELQGVRLAELEAALRSGALALSAEDGSRAALTLRYDTETREVSFWAGETRAASVHGILMLGEDTLVFTSVTGFRLA
jgi:Ca2+-binding RTX toxin-like protein